MTITLKTLPQATEQEVFNQVVTHLLTQKEKSEQVNVDRYATCLYRGPRGLKCAAGCLIADDEYTPDMDSGAETGWAYSVMNRALFPKDHMYLIAELQRIHDVFKAEEWEGKLKECAERNNLQFNWKEAD